MTKNTEEIYNNTADLWSRREPNSLSDFTARPIIFDLCGDVSELKVVDLGCGEGYCARVLESRGAANVEGIELSQKMVDLAKEQQSSESKINYKCGDVTVLPYPDEIFDLAIGVFVYNYLDSERMKVSFEEVFRVLKKDGVFIFSVPHPAFPFIRSEKIAPFYFDVEEYGYFSARNKTFNGKIFCRDDTALSVQMIPKTFNDYFAGLSDAGFKRMPYVDELGVTNDMLQMDQQFFSPIKDIPLHLVFKLHK